MRFSSLSTTLTFALAGAALVAACGGSAPPPEAPPAPPPPSAASAPAPAKTAETRPAKSAEPAAATSATPPPAPAKKEMPAIQVSKMADALKEIGLDVQKLPAMAKLTAAQRVKVMPILGKATGMECNDCHDANDKKKDTPNKLVARKMWDDYVVAHKLDGGGLFCDSCHQGKNDFLARGDRDAVSAFMEANYVKKLAKKAGKGDVACTTCHGEDFEMKIFEKVWKVKPAHKAEADGEARPVLGMR